VALLSYLAEKEGKDSLFFADAFAKNKEDRHNWDRNYWEYTATKITPPENRDSYPLDNDGRYTGLIWEHRLDKGMFVPIAEQKIPRGNGNVVVTIEPATGIPLETISGFNTKHAMHWYFNPQLKENIVLFGYGWYCIERGSCFYTFADYRPHYAVDVDGFRPVRGLFGDVEKIAKT
jgi:hypothetical protein